MNILIRLCLEWDQFVQSSIKLWETLYLKWLTHGKSILILRYDDLQSPGIRIQIMKDVCSFLSFKLDVNRLNCVSKSRYSIFERKKQCLKVVPKVVKELLQRDKYFNTSD